MIFSISILFVGLSAVAGERCVYIKGNAETEFPPLKNAKETPFGTLTQRGKFAGYTIELTQSDQYKVLTAMKGDQHVASAEVEVDARSLTLFVRDEEFTCTLQ